MIDYNRLKMFAVWLILLGVLCVGVDSGEAVAKEYIVIGTEGDPTDGFDIEGGGSGGGGSGVPDGGKENEASAGGVTGEYPSVIMAANWVIGFYDWYGWIQIEIDVSKLERLK